MITAVMITGLQRGFSNMPEVAIECFQRQTHPDKELLIINHGVKSYCGKNIREIKIKKLPDMHVGRMRNMAFEHGYGDWLMTWDDDDWHSPERMAYQAKAISGKKMILLSRRLVSDLILDRKIVGFEKLGCRNSMLFPRSTKIRFPNWLTGSCGQFREWFKFNKIVLDNDPSLYVLNVHGKNLLAGSANLEHGSQLDESQKSLVSMVRGLYKTIEIKEKID